jgi:hypothetical protein
VRAHKAAYKICSRPTQPEKIAACYFRTSNPSNCLLTKRSGNNAGTPKETYLATYGGGWFGIGVIPFFYLLLQLQVPS